MNNDLNSVQGIKPEQTNQYKAMGNSTHYQNTAMPRPQVVQQNTNLQQTPIQNMNQHSYYEQEKTQDNKAEAMAAVSNLNKEEAMEDALSHTTQYSPFELPKQEVNQEIKKTSKTGVFMFFGLIFLIMLLFILFLPQIFKLFGW